MINSFVNKHILVIGDIILDEYVFGDVTRINPEAPVPVLEVKKTEYRLGGAANVANNITSLGADCTLIGQVGNSKITERLIRLLEKNRINHHLIKFSNFPTIKKTRIIAQTQQIIRIDQEKPTKLEDEYVERIKNIIKQKEPDLIIISDYNKGMITKKLMTELKKLKVKIVADIKPINSKLFKGVYAITPNLKEAKEITKEDELEKAGKILVNKLDTNTIITAGAKGAYLFERKIKNFTHFPAQAQEVYDVSGAGDTFISVIGLSLASGLSLKDSVSLANKAAGIVVGKMGTSTITQEELEKNKRSKRRDH